MNLYALAHIAAALFSAVGRAPDSQSESYEFARRGKYFRDGLYWKRSCLVASQSWVM